MTDKIAEGSLRHTQKTKAHDRLSKQRSNFAEVREKVARLDLATKIVRNIVAPKKSLGASR